VDLILFFANGQSETTYTYKQFAETSIFRNVGKLFVVEENSNELSFKLYVT